MIDWWWSSPRPSSLTRVEKVQICWLEQFANCQLEFLWNLPMSVFFFLFIFLFFCLKFKESRDRRISWNNDLLSAAPIESEIWSRSDLLIISKAAKHTFYCWHTFNQAEENTWTKIVISSDYFKGFAQKKTQNTYLHSACRKCLLLWLGELWTVSSWRANQISQFPKYF